MVALIAYSLLIAGNLPAQKYQLQSTLSQLEWTGKAAYSAYALSGTLQASEGHFTLEEGRIVNASLVIDMQSLDAEIKDLKKHLRSDDFFDVKRFPIATFELTEPTELNEGSIILSGIFTIKGVSKPETLRLNAQKRSGTWVFVGTFSLDRTQYGIYYNSPNFFKNLKQEAIADEIEMAFSLVFQP
jgi:polyisoprenoid-binding protein YceI